MKAEITKPKNQTEKWRPETIQKNEACPKSLTSMLEGRQFANK